MNPEELRRLDNIEETVRKIDDLFYRMSQNDKFLLNKPLVLQGTELQFEVVGGGNGKVYMDSNGNLYFKDKAGTAYRITPTVVKNGTATRAGNTASGSQTIAHGCGGIPTRVRISAKAKWTGDSTAQSDGTYNGSTTATSYIARDATAGNVVSGVSTSFIIYMYDSATGTTLQTASITVDATNITLAWTLTGAGHANNMNLMWEAEIF